MKLKIILLLVFFGIIVSIYSGVFLFFKKNDFYNTATNINSNIKPETVIKIVDDRKQELLVKPTKKITKVISGEVRLIDANKIVIKTNEEIIDLSLSSVSSIYSIKDAKIVLLTTESIKNGIRIKVEYDESTNLILSMRIYE